MSTEADVGEVFEQGSETLGTADNLRVHGDVEAAQSLYREALESFERMLELAPDSGMAHLGRGYSLGMLGDDEAAFNEFEGAAELDPSLSAQTHNFRGFLLELRGNLNEALVYYQAAAEASPENPLSQLNVGDVRLALGDPAGAVEAYSRALELDQSMPGPYLSRAFAYANVGKNAEAAVDIDEAFRRLETQTALDVNERHRLLVVGGEARAFIGDDGGAYEAFSRAVELAPENVAGYAGQAGVLARRGDYAGAIAAYSSVLELDPANIAALRLRGVYFEALGYAQEAYEDYDRVIELGSAEAEDYRNRADATRALGRDSEAVADYTRALELDPQLVVAYHARGRSRGALDDYEGAVEDFTAALEVDQSSIEVRRTRGIYLEVLHRYQEAYEDYDLVIRGGSDGAEDYRNRADAAAALGRLEEARADYTTALERDPALVDAYIGRGGALRGMGETEPALRDYESALSLDPRNAEALEGRAAMFADQGEHERAVTDYERALNLDPDNVQLYRNLVLEQFELGDDFSARGLDARWRRTYEKSLAVIAKGLEVLPDDPWLMGYEAVCYRIFSAYDRAVEKATAALETPAAEDPNAAAWLLRERADSLRLWGVGADRPAKLEEALRDLERAAEIAGEAAEALIFELWGNTLAELARFEAAVKQFEEAARRDGGVGWPHVGKGKAQYFQGDFEAAVATFSEVLSSDPTPDLAGLANLGTALALEGQDEEASAESAFAASLAGREDAPAYYERAGRLVQFKAFDRAEDDFLRALGLDPEHTDALNELAWLFVHDWPRPDRLEGAFKLALRAVEVQGDGPGLPNYLDTAGWIAFKLDRQEEAVSLLRKAVELDSYDVLIRAHLEEAEGVARSGVNAVAKARRNA